MGLILVGANHRTAPVNFREQLAYSDENCVAELRKWTSTNCLTEALILSTCNRVDLVAMTSDQQQHDHLVELLSESKALSKAEFNKHSYRYIDEEAVRHVFRVASSLDSMVVGEPQVLGQLRKAYSLATTAGAVGPILNKLLPRAFHVAKRVRNETDVASSAVSVSYMAVELGRKIFDSLVERTVLVIGGGGTAELAARHLMKSGVSTVLFANRTQSKADELAKTFGGKAVAMDQLVDHLSQADIVICSTSSAQYVITADMVRAADSRRRRQTPTFFIDVSVPRNIDPTIGTVENSFVFNIDDLKSLVLSNLDHRQREAQRAELIVNQEVVSFREVLRGLMVGPAITQLRERMREIAREEFSRYRNDLGVLSAEQEAALENLLFSTIKKISHPIITEMRRGALEVQL